ncbi:MAG: acyl carrier protein [Candidatus Scalindua sp.]
MKSNKGAKNIGETAATMLEIIEGLVAELHPRQLPVQAVSFDNSLDRDLGLDSLARVELLARIERSFGVVLQERVFADAETPRDLLRALLGASGSKVTHVVHDVSKKALGKVGRVPQVV